MHEGLTLHTNKEPMRIQHNLSKKKKWENKKEEEEEEEESDMFPFFG